MIETQQYNFPAKRVSIIHVTQNKEAVSPRDGDQLRGIRRNQIVRQEYDADLSLARRNIQSTAPIQSQKPLYHAYYELKWRWFAPMRSMCYAQWISILHVNYITRKPLEKAGRRGRYNPSLRPAFSNPQMTVTQALNRKLWMQVLGYTS